MKNKIMKWAESNVNILSILSTILLFSFIIGVIQLVNYIPTRSIPEPNNIYQAKEFLNFEYESKLVCQYDPNGILNRNITNISSCKFANGILYLPYCLRKVKICNDSLYFAENYINNLLNTSKLGKLAQLVEEKSNNKNCLHSQLDYEDNIYCRAIKLELENLNLKNNILSENDIMKQYYFNKLKNKNQNTNISHKENEETNIKARQLINYL